MTEDIHPFAENPCGEDAEGLVRPVDPADLRSVWAMQREFQARTPGQHAGFSTEFYEQACGPGANVNAVWFRFSMLAMLEMLGMLEPWIHEGVPVDAVFQVAAALPMKGVAIGVPREGLPFDVQEFFSQVAKS